MQCYECRSTLDLNDIMRGHKQCAGCRCSGFGEPAEGPEQYAHSSWTIEDVQAVFDVSDADARAFLAKYESDIRDGMNQRGWETIEHYGKAEGWKAVDDE